MKWAESTSCLGVKSLEWCVTMEVFLFEDIGAEIIGAEIDVNPDDVEVIKPSGCGNNITSCL